VAHNEANGLTPEPLRKKIHDILDDIYREAEDTETAIGGHGPGGHVVGGGGRQMSRGKGPVPETRSRSRGSSVPARAGMARAELAQLIQDLNDQMLAAARELQFELAARIRDEVGELKKELRGMDLAGVK
jgi:excinuclease ABC subunit B